MGFGAGNSAEIGRGIWVLELLSVIRYPLSITAKKLEPIYLFLTLLLSYSLTLESRPLVFSSLALSFSRVSPSRFLEREALLALNPYSSSEVISCAVS